jgi:hypothetical protein
MNPESRFELQGPEIGMRKNGKNLLVDIDLELVEPDVQALNRVRDLQEQQIRQPSTPQHDRLIRERGTNGRGVL